MMKCDVHMILLKYNFHKIFLKKFVDNYVSVKFL